MATELKFYGQSAFKITTPQGNVVLIDPWLKNPKLADAEAELRALERVDVICLTHGHSDHVGETVEIARKTKAKLICTADLAPAMAATAGFPKEQISPELIGHLGGEISALGGEVKVRFVPAWHGSGLDAGETDAPAHGGTPTGLVLTINHGPTIYHTGDTDLFSDMSLIPLERAIDWMLVCIGDHFTMGPERAAYAAELVKPKFIVPMHFGTFPLLTGTPEMLETALKARGVISEMRVMKPGEKLALDSKSEENSQVTFRSIP